MHNRDLSAAAGRIGRLAVSVLGLAAFTATTFAYPGDAVAGAAPAGRATTVGCRISQLPIPDEAWRSTVTGGDPTGRYLIGDATVSGPTGSTVVPLLWVGGRLRQLPAQPGETSFADVNASGTVLARTSDDRGRAFAWLYKAGRVTRLPGLRPTDSTYPVALNSRGDAIGYSEDVTHGLPGTFHMVLWPAHRPQKVRELIAPRPANLLDIDNDGTVLASSFTDINRTYLWPPRRPVRALPGPSGTADFGAVTLRKGWVTGVERFTTPGAASAVAWNLRTGAVNRVATENSSPSTGNGRGDMIVGIDAPAIAHRDGRIVELPALAGGEVRGATFLSDRGMAAGWARDGAVYAVVWRGC